MSDSHGPLNENSTEKTMSHHDAENPSSSSNVASSLKTSAQYRSFDALPGELLLKIFGYASLDPTAQTYRGIRAITARTYREIRALQRLNKFSSVFAREVADEILATLHKTPYKLNMNDILYFTEELRTTKFTDDSCETAKKNLYLESQNQDGRLTVLSLYTHITMTMEDTEEDRKCMDWLANAVFAMRPNYRSRIPHIIHPETRFTFISKDITGKMQEDPWARFCHFIGPSNREVFLERNGIVSPVEVVSWAEPGPGGRTRYGFRDIVTRINGSGGAELGGG